MEQITHGASASKKRRDISTPVVAESGIHFVVGTAPVQMAGGKANEVIMARSYEEAVSKLGYSDDWGKYGLCEEIYSAFRLYGASPVFLVNVLDPEKHKKDVEAKTLKPEGNQILLPLEAIADSVKVTGMERGTGFDTFYDGNNCVVEFLGETTQAEGVEIQYSEVDPGKVTKEDVIGGYDVERHEKMGMELIDHVFPKYSYAPDLILCPNWSHEPEVAAVMAAKAENINGIFEAMAIIDVDTDKEKGVTDYSGVPEWKKKKNITRETQIVCFPKVALGDRVFNFSTQLAGSMSATDNEEDLGGGTPCESASNKSLQADRMVTADGTEVVMDLRDASYLNENGIVTGLNFYSGFTSWGSYTACYPHDTNPEDYFYNINRMFRWVAKSVILSHWSRIDRRMTRVLVDAILQGINDWLNGLSAEGKIVGGRVELKGDENPTSALVAGKAKYHIYLAVSSPLQKIEYVLEFDLSYIEAAFAA